MFWKKEQTKTFEEDRDYKFHPYGEEQSLVELFVKPYEGVCFVYGGVRFEPQGEAAVLAFQYTILHSGATFTDEELRQDANFKTLLGDLLTILIIEQKAIDEKNRTDDIEGDDL